MKQLVCISKTPETTANIQPSSDGNEIQKDGINNILNPYDEWYALVRAIELKEQVGGTVTVINVGPAENDAVIRKALAIGADDAIRINTDPESALQVAKHISSAVKDGAYDIIYTGKESIDYNGSLVGGMIAELLDLPYVSYASSMTMEGNTANLVRDIEGGTESVSVGTPFVVSAAKGMAEQRIPNMRGIMMSKRKPIEVVEPGDASARVNVSQYSKPQGKSSVKMVDPENMDELVRLLQEEAKVL